ncbi:hypothetical protein D3872_17710 [Massilia cavernae]|uniref:Dienelactone hydrolase domain-containing protein n=1 Tax=Massilia cavernae TaxID=2320864 RepID=A0A418XPK9_9BURK|nr:hypothetical protein D3872_17710 [Massilia cavernae]
MPSLHVSCTDDIILIPGYYSGAGDRVAVFDATGSARKWLAVYQGGSHSMFTDRAGVGGAALNARVKMATQALSVAFIGAALGDHAYGPHDWARVNASILARFSVAGV